MAYRRKRIGRPRRVGRPRKVHRARGRPRKRVVHRRKRGRGVGIASILSRIMHKKAGYGHRRRRAPIRRHRGRGIFDSIWSGLKSGYNWLREHKPISRIAGMINHPYAQKVGEVAGALGFGRRRRHMRGRGMRGCGFAVPGVMVGRYPYSVLQTQSPGITHV